MFNEVPNNNGAMYAHLTNNVHLTTRCAYWTSSMVVIMQNTQEKADLLEMKVNDTKTGRFVWIEKINFVLGNNGGITSSSLGDILIAVVRQWVSEWVSEMKYQQFA